VSLQPRLIAGRASFAFLDLGIDLWSYGVDRFVGPDPLFGDADVAGGGVAQVTDVDRTSGSVHGGDRANDQREPVSDKE
jgi:hypothetical protein